MMRTSRLDPSAAALEDAPEWERCLLGVLLDPGTVAIYQDIVGQSTFTFSPQLADVRASKIPASPGLGLPGLTVFLPADPSDGDSYEFRDVDGSCGINNLVLIKPDPGGTATVGRLPG